MWADHQPWWGGWDSHSYCYREGLRAGAGAGPGSGVTGQRTAGRTGQFSHYPTALLGTGLMQALTLLLAVAVGPGSGCPHSTPPPPRSHRVSAQRTRPPAELAGPRGCPDLAARWSAVSAHFSSAPGDLRVAQPRWVNSVQGMAIRKWRGVLPTLESPGWAVPTLTPQWKAAQLPLLLFVFKGELNTLTKQETVPAPAKAQCSALSPP